MNGKKITEIGAAAALYAVLTVLLSPISFGMVQCRFSDSALFFCKTNKRFIWGCSLGCAIANFASPLGIADVLCGVFANFLAGSIIHHAKSKTVSIVAGAATLGVVVGVELSFFYSIPVVLSILSVFVGEVISLSVGCLIFTEMRKRLCTL